MKDPIIPPRILKAIGTLATLFGIILAFDAIAQSMADQKSVGWAVFAVVAACLSAISIVDDVFAYFGDVGKASDRLRRRAAGLSAVFLFLVFAGMCGLFRF